MKIIRAKTAEDYQALQGSEIALAIGNFDGVHYGHRQLISRLKELAKPRGYQTAVMSFDPHPMRVLKPKIALAKISTVEEQERLLGDIGIDYFIVQKFSPDFAVLTAEEFARTFFQERMGVRLLVVGHDFAFGAHRKGDFSFQQSFCAENGIFLERVSQVCLPTGEQVSTSAVRKALDEGDMELATRLLTRPFRIRGKVVAGAGRGKGIGIPTINLEVEGETLPQRGVYAGSAIVPGIGRNSAVINIGFNPTFGNDQSLTVEAHLLDIKGNFYGQLIEIDFLHRLRSEQKFATVDQLVAQIQSDIKTARYLLK